MTKEQQIIFVRSLRKQLTHALDLVDFGYATENLDRAVDSLNYGLEQLREDAAQEQRETADPDEE